MIVPKIIYGTAWKEQRTTQLVEDAVIAGFRAIDTANQAKHYSEPLVGEALLNLEKRGIKRSDLWLQSKFTSIEGQDERLPYNANSDLATQVEQSFFSSLEHLHTEYIDSYIIHGPINYPDLGTEDFEVWNAIEKIYESQKAKQIGISNVNILQIETLCEKAKIKPHFVQNRCYANRGWDKDVREFCISNNIHYQGFSLLTANPQIVQNPDLHEIAQKHNKTTAQIIFRLSHQLGIIPLTGTTNKEHMSQDLDIWDFKLSQEELSMII